MTNTMSSSRCEPLWMPRRAVLMRDRLLASFEPRRSENPAGGRFALKPTVSVAGHSRDHPPGPPTLRANSSRLRLTLHQGNMRRCQGREVGVASTDSDDLMIEARAALDAT